MWSSIQVLPNQVSKKSFYMFEDIDLQESHAKLHKKQRETLGADLKKIAICLFDRVFNWLPWQQ